jgi:hypothetical protein
VADYVDDEFEWDIAKSEATRRRRGFDFFLASRIFADRYVTLLDETYYADEPRFKCTGLVSTKFVTVIATDRGSRMRIISARPATRNEIDDYAKEYGL